MHSERRTQEEPDKDFKDSKATHDLHVPSYEHISARVNAMLMSHDEGRALDAAKELCGLDACTLSTACALVDWISWSAMGLDGLPDDCYVDAKDAVIHLIVSHGDKSSEYIVRTLEQALAEGKSASLRALLDLVCDTYGEDAKDDEFFGQSHSNDYYRVIDKAALSRDTAVASTAQRTLREMVTADRYIKECRRHF